MTNIFMMFVPLGNHEAVVHYEDTIKNKVLPDRIFKFVDSDLRYRLNDFFGGRLIPVWGSRDTENNRATFDRMKQGDDILIVEGKSIKLLGKIAAKTVNPNLSNELWKNLRGGTTQGWDLIYFIANPIEIDLPFSEFNSLFDYKPGYVPRGFSAVAETKLKDFYGKYDDLYSILQRIKSGMAVEEKGGPVTDTRETTEKMAPPEEDVALDEVLDQTMLSDHIVMQFKIARLGIKAGSKVWVPRNNQQRIVKEYQFGDFEKEFSTGIDVPIRYVENIDVVWKEEFRIDAAFEIENTTTIYSGLLRFSDLKIVAPNSNYPLFVVAPTAKRNRLVDQLNRPTFKKLDFRGKVRFLPYEQVNKIYQFFEGSEKGLNVELLIGQSEEFE
jgi:hypothetical protein